MEILKLWVRCIAAAGQMKNRPMALRQLVILARAAQEYYTSGLWAQDCIDEIKNSRHTHPYLYDGTPYKPLGLAKIVTKYNIQKPHTNAPSTLADALHKDFRDGTIPDDGSVPYACVTWPNSRVLQAHIYTETGYIYPKDGLPLALGQMLAAARQK